MMNQIMFGTDSNPYGGQDAVKENLNRLLSFQLSQAELEAIGRGTAAKLLPKQCPVHDTSASQKFVRSGNSRTNLGLIPGSANHQKITK